MNISKTFRLFISSTFSDFKKERKILHEDVFPLIDKYLAKKHPDYTFQPIDLRWGVNAEAQLDQKTLEICLNEVKACKHYLHPNFLIMVGNRYGWISLPYAIEKSEFEDILFINKENQYNMELLTCWYQEDTNYRLNNGTTNAYVLKERFPEEIYNDWKVWEGIESKLRTILQKSATKLFKKNTEEYNKYFNSATELEVKEGISHYSDDIGTQEAVVNDKKSMSKLDEKYVFGFSRDITNQKNISYTKETTSLFIDPNQENIEKFKYRLKKSGIEIKEEKVTVETFLDDGIILEDENKYIENFKRFILNRLKSHIDDQVSNQEEITPLEKEISEQKEFKRSKIEIFEGRETEINILMNHINNKVSQPVMIYGGSGIGKTAFIAKFIDNIKKDQKLKTTLCYRFIGATVSSSNIRTLLESIIDELSSKGIVKKPEKYEDGVQKFNLQIKDLLNTIDNETIIVLDALDQLFQNDQLRWLPEILPEKLKIIVSVINKDTYYDLLVRDIKIDQCNQIPIKAISKKEVESILDQLLKKENRELTPDQKNYLLEQIEKSGNSPLYLKIAFEEAKIWKSSSNDSVSVGIDNIIIEFIMNLSKKFHHDEKVVYKLLGLISASKEGLSEKQILDLLSSDNLLLDRVENHYHTLNVTIDGEEIRKFPISVWVRLLDQLKPFLSERVIDDQRLIGFFHRQFYHVLNKQFSNRDYRRFNDELINYFQKIHSNIDDKFSIAFLSNIKNLMYHLYRNDRDEELKNILGENIQSLFFLTSHMREELAVYIEYLNTKDDIKEYLVEKTFELYSTFLTEPEEIDWIMSTSSFPSERVEQDWFIPNLYSNLLNIGKLLDYAGLPQKSLEVYTETIKQNLEWYSEHNVFVSNHIFQIAEIHFLLHNTEESKKYFNLLLTIEPISNPFYKDNIKLYNQLHETNVVMSKARLSTYNQNIEYLSNSDKENILAVIYKLDIKNFFSSDDPEKIFDEIIKMNEDDMLNFLKVLRDNIPNKTYNDLTVQLNVILGFRCYQKQDYKNALEYYFAAKKVLLLEYDEKHYRMGWVYPGISLCYIKDKQFIKGQNYLFETIEAIESYEEGTHPKTVFDLALLEYERTVGLLEVLYKQIMENLDNVEYVTTLIDLAVDNIQKDEIYAHPLSLQILLIKANLLKRVNEKVKVAKYIEVIIYYANLIYDKQDHEYLMLKNQIESSFREYLER